MQYAPGPSSIRQQGIANASKNALVGGIIATTFATLSEEGGFSTQSVFQNVIQIGAPAIVGGLVANLIVPPPDNMNDLLMNSLYRVPIAGVVSVGILMAAGAIPATLDGQAIMLGLIVGGSVVVGDVVMDLLGGSVKY